MAPQLPRSITNDRSVVAFLNSILDKIIPATQDKAGLVQQAEASVAINASTVTPNATYNQAQVTQIVTDLNAVIAAYKDLKAKMQAAGQMES